ncbi:potassium channel family protein [Malacoplasma muris]|uniref:potassium channel family protein n=1 Tax=Malacoplasma muris TaxID=2119 RepID=UPI00398F69EE
MALKSKSEKKKDNYLIIGYGKFGQGFAQRLLDERVKENRIYIVDRNQELLNSAINTFSNVINASIVDFDSINSFDINDISIVVIGMADIEESLMIAANCKKYNDKIYFAKAKNSIHSKLLKTLGVDEVVVPEYEVGSKLAYKSLFKMDIDINDISLNYNIVHFKVNNDKVVGKKIVELNLREKFDCSIFGIRRDNKFFVPNANEIIKKNDKVSIVCKKEDSNEIIKFFVE